MVLLTNTIIAMSITGIVLILGIAGFVFYLSRHNSRKITIDFLNGLADEIYKLIVQTIKDFKIDEFDIESLEEYEAEVLKKLYNTVYTYVMDEMKSKASENDSPITYAMLALLKQEDVDKLLMSVYENGNAKILIKDAWAKYFENKVDSIESTQDVAIGHDIDGNEIIYSGNDYNEDFDEKHDLPVVEEEIINQDDHRVIIPPADTENAPITDDLVMEGEPEKPYIKQDTPIEEDLPISYTETNVSEEDDLPYFIDKNGRKRDKITGRYTK